MRSSSLTLIALSLLILSGLVWSQDAELYHKIRLTAPTKDQIIQLKMAGLPMEESAVSKDGSIEIVLYEWELQIVRSLGVDYIVLQEDLATFYAERWERTLREGLPLRERTDPVHMKYGSMGGFYTYQQVVMDLDSMNLLYPNICAPRDSIGAGWNGNVLWMVKISDNPGINEDEPEVEYDALHHAREPGAYTALMYAMWWLLENYGIDPEATHLIDNREMFFIPVANPDGLLHNQSTNPGGGGNWRKNRRNNGGSYGVDLNRNYGYQWGYDNIGSSPTPSSDTYRGPSAFSEPETQAIRDFCLAHDFRTAMTVHTSGDHYLYAYGYAAVNPESLAIHQEYGAEVSRDNGYNYGTCYGILYASNGRTQDWELHTSLTINIEPEIGAHGFWPSSTYIFPEARDNLHCILWQAWCGGAKIGFESVTPVGGEIAPGQICSLMVSLKNRGMGSSITEATVTLTENSPYLVLVHSAHNYGVFSAREIRDNSADPFRISVMPLTPQGTTVTVGIEIQYDDYFVVDSLYLTIGTPIEAFADDAESGTANWSLGSWGLTSSYAHSPSRSFTDSPYGNYSNNQTNIMTMQGVVDISSLQNPMLKFWTRYEIEAAYDFGQVEASSNGGSSWIPLEGLYTESGSGIGVQPSGQPGYDGFRTNWVEETMSLSAFAGINNFKVRFEFRSDGGVVEDGWYVDDIRVAGYQPSPPPQICDLIILWTPDGAELIWTPIPGATSYHVYKDTQPIYNVNMLQIDSTVSGPPYVDTEAVNQTCRFYAITYEY